MMAADDYKEGFGVVDVDGLDMRTVSPTRRAAIVNWLVVSANRVVSIYTSDQQIDALWDAHRGDAMVVPVRVYVQG